MQNQKPLNWEEFMSEQTKAIKTALDGFADWMDGTMNGGNGLSINIFMISPTAMGCGGYRTLPCGSYDLPKS